jgi:PPOX class probable F420-dependent enzyme
VWVARDGDALVVTTPAGTGKVTRLRRDPRVQLRPCSRLGAVEPGAETWSGTAEVLDSDAAVRGAHAALRAKYGLLFSVLTRVERLRRSHRARVIVRITGG